VTPRWKTIMEKDSSDNTILMWLGIIVVIVSVFYYWQSSSTQNSKNARIPVVVSTPNIQKNNHPTSIIPKQKSDSQNSNQKQFDSSYSMIVAEWQDRVAKIICSWNYVNGQEYNKNQASGLLVNYSDVGIALITNKHVVEDASGYAPNTCIVGVYDKGIRVVVTNYGSSIHPFVKGDRDWVYIKLGDGYATSTSPDGGVDKFDEIASKKFKICQGKVNVGDKLLVLGYPAIGAKQGITATDGIVSGLEGDYYITSAKIDHGNSGGAAILLKDDCYLGIPTWAERQIGGFESLGRILKSSFVFGN